jgi:phage repressor protein C with HTH and peptisase S24 domain
MFKNDNGKSDCIERIPLLPVMMDGKRIEDYEMDNSLASENVVPPVPNVTHASTIIGDSMSPEYLNGSRIFLSKIDFRKFIEWGRTYEIETSNGVIVKNVFPCKSEESKIVCRSINNNYSDFEVDIDDVISMYRVIAVLTLK